MFKFKILILYFLGTEQGCMRPEAKDLIQKLLDNNYETRLGCKGAKAIKQHSFFSGSNLKISLIFN